jgi:death-on-curing family protein
MESITIQEVERVAHRVARKTMQWNEPIPDFDTRYPGVLESCLATPFQQFERKHPYKGLVGKGSVLFYLLVKNHPFKNGNKRIAVTTLLYFLYKNDKWIRLDNQELYNFARWVAESNPKVRRSTIEAIQEFIDEHLGDVDSEEW